ncbi:Transposase [Erysipelothrix urinaevulpis]
MVRRPRRTFTKEFKTQIVNLYLGGKKKSEILREYDLHAVTLDRWIKQHQGTGSFKEADNRTPEEKELIELRKRNQQLEMENDILKQEALIMGRKSK